MSSLANIMDAEETENWVEQRSTAVAEWSTRKTGRKERWEVDRVGEMSKLEPSKLYITAEAIEPGGEQLGGTLNLKSEEKGGYLPATNSSPSYHPRYPKPKNNR